MPEHSLIAKKKQKVLSNDCISTYKLYLIVILFNLSKIFLAGLRVLLSSATCS